MRELRVRVTVHSWQARLHGGTLVDWVGHAFAMLEGHGLDGVGLVLSAPGEAG